MTATTHDSGTVPASPPWQPRGHPVRVAMTLLIVAVVISASAAFTGVLAPAVKVQSTGATAALVKTQPVILYLNIDNYRSAAIRLESVGESLPGLALDSVEVANVDFPNVKPFEPTRIDDDDGIRGFQIKLTYRITDCSAVPSEHIGVPVVARSALGRTTTTRQRVTLAPAPTGTYSYGSSDDPNGEPWQTTLTRVACHS